MQSTIPFDIFLLVMLVANIFAVMFITYSNARVVDDLRTDLITTLNDIRYGLADLFCSIKKTERHIKEVELAIADFKATLEEVSDLVESLNISTSKLPLTDKEIEDFMRSEAEFLSSRAFSKKPDEPLILEDDGDTPPTNNTNQP